VALITDGRFSGASRGAAIGHVSPEAAAKGRLPRSRKGTSSRSTLSAKTLNFRLSQAEVKRRLSALPQSEPKIKSGYLGRYAELVSSADKARCFQGDMLETRYEMPDTVYTGCWMLDDCDLKPVR